MAPPSLRLKVERRAEMRCEYCRAPQSISAYTFHIEHIHPVNKGGKDLTDNLALACASCNLHKSNKTEALDPETQTQVALFNPRNDTWERAFEWTNDYTEIKGVTAQGRATVIALSMNHNPDRVEARKLWHLAGYLP